MGLFLRSGSWLTADVSQMSRIIWVCTLLVLVGCSHRHAPEVTPILIVSEGGTWSDPEAFATPKLALYSDGTAIYRQYLDYGRHRYLTCRLDPTEFDPIATTAHRFFTSDLFEDFYRQSNATDEFTSTITYCAGTVKISTGIYGAGLFSVFRTPAGVGFDSSTVGLPSDLNRLLLLLSFATQNCVDDWIPTLRDSNGYPIFPHHASAAHVSPFDPAKR